MKWVLKVVAVLILLVVGVYAIGWNLPETHSVSVSRIVLADPPSVWRALTEASRFPEWRSAVDEVEILPMRDDMPAWREEGPTGALTLVATEWDPPRRLGLRIADVELPFGGTWTYDLEPEGEGTRVTIREDGEIYSAFFRFMARFVFGYEATAQQYLDDLDAWTSPPAAEA